MSFWIVYLIGNILHSGIPQGFVIEPLLFIIYVNAITIGYIAIFLILYGDYTLLINLVFAND